MKPRIGFVGVGRMGANMARCLKDHKYKITAVYDVNRTTAQSVADELGAAHCTRLADVTAASDVVFTVVTDDAAMRSIFLGKSDNLLSDANGKIFVNCATLSPAIHVEVEKAARRHGAEALEACMASSISQARSGTLYLMIGGQQETYDKVKKVLKKLSISKRFVGPAGTAAQVKALVNMVMNINTAGLAEGLGLGAALGLDLDMLREVFSQTGANSRVLETDGGDMQAREHECWFSAAHAAKDSGIALDLGKEKSLTLPLAAATKAQYDRMVAEGLGELDKSGVAELTFPGRHAQSAKPNSKAKPKAKAKAKTTGRAKSKRPTAKKKKATSARRSSAKAAPPAPAASAMAAATTAPITLPGTAATHTGSGPAGA